MKYARTKDGEIRIVIDPNEFDEEERRKIPDNCTMVKANNIYGCAIVGNENIVKQADTIVELCDGLIDTDTHFSKIESDNLWDIDELENLQITYEVWNEGEKGRYNVYGYIQTDKGLIYVAKMNDKGELELL